MGGPRRSGITFAELGENYAMKLGYPWRVVCLCAAAAPIMGAAPPVHQNATRARAGIEIAVHDAGRCDAALAGASRSDALPKDASNLGERVPVAPLNDSRKAALQITEGTMPGSTRDATPDGVSAWMPQSADVWYEYVAPEDGQLIVETCGSKFDTFLELWDGAPVESAEDSRGRLIAINDDECDTQSVIVADMQRDHVYTIRVAGHEEARGAFVLTIKPIPAGPPHGGAAAADASTEGGVAGGLVGPDVVLSDCRDVANFGAVEGIRAYAISSHTCNVGDVDLHWGGTWQGTPSLGMNAYRLYDGRLEQIGLSFVKQACCAGAGNGCGAACNGIGGTVLGIGCLDVYSAGWNGGQSRLGLRSAINAFSGAHTPAVFSIGDAIFKRLQIHEHDLSDAAYPGALYFLEGVYVAADDARVNPYNNASYRRVTVAAETLDLTPVDATQAGQPAIRAWRANGLGVGQVDPRVVDSEFSAPQEGRFFMAHKVSDLGAGVFRYEYAIFNLNSDRGGGSLSLEIPAGARVTKVAFHDVDYHSGEIYDNSDWTVVQSGDRLTWRSPQTFAENPNSNALRWGTMYSFWFECDRPPTVGALEFGLFKPAPGMPDSVRVAARVPGNVAGDLNCDGLVNNFDIDPFVVALVSPADYLLGYPGCRLLNADVNGSGAVDNFDIEAFLAVLGLD